MMRIPTVFIAVCLLLLNSCAVAADPVDKHSATKIVPAAERINEYLPLIKDKRVAVFGNHTSMVGDKHLVDTLKKLGVNIVKIFAPEHGFRGTADAGEKVDNTVDQNTGIRVVSLYGKKLRPSKEDLADVDVIVFDIQDVGARFYTYINSLEECMKSAAESNKPILVLDRPNPNGFYIDGPVLDTAFKSFIGLQPIPVVYGMTIGEYGQMLLGEQWVKTNGWNKLSVIKCAGYDHTSKYQLPVRPSPNLPEMQSIYWYPSTCFFEGTVFSEGRGTEKPFQYIGHPSLPKSMFAFTPVSREGATSPKQKDKTCYGYNLAGPIEEVLKKTDGRIQIGYLIDAYKLFPNKDSFFLANKFINKLAGNNILMKQIREGKTEDQIRASWQPQIKAFKQLRKKYLLYKDFE
jgi:uncharacterized protein YbbC (DUF1343 family)